MELTSKLNYVQYKTKDYEKHMNIIKKCFKEAKQSYQVRVSLYLNKHIAIENLNNFVENTGLKLYALGSFAINKNKGQKYYSVELTQLSTRKLWRVLHNFINSVERIELQKEVFYENEETEKEYSVLETLKTYKLKEAQND